MDKKISRLDREWHLKNKMPKNPTEAQRADWHREHHRFCACRPLTENIKKLLKDNKK